MEFKEPHPPHKPTQLELTDFRFSIRGIAGLTAGVALLVVAVQTVFRLVKLDALRIALMTGLLLFAFACTLAVGFAVIEWLARLSDAIESRERAERGDRENETSE